MANPKKSNKQKEEELRLLIQKRRKIFTMAITLVIAIIVVIGVLIGSGIMNSLLPSSSGSNSITSGQFIKMSSSDASTSSGVNIYYLSWAGCPIGASDSWFIYNYVHTQDPGLKNSTIYNKMHFSDPNESPSNIPGLLFNNFTYTLSGVSYNFHVIYVYGQYLPPDGPSSVSQGSAVLKEYFPSSISSLFLKYETQDPTTGLGGQAIANYAGHLTSSLIVTGPSGTYYAEGELYNPSTIKGIQPTVLIETLSQYSGITTSTSAFGTAVSSVV